MGSCTVEDSLDIDVETYLRQVKLQNDSIPKVVVSDTVESKQESLNGSTEDSKATKQFNRLIHIDQEYQKLDSGFKLTPSELKYFEILKRNISNSFGIQNNRTESSMWNYALKVCERSGFSKEDPDEIWNTLLTSDPPSVIDLCKGGLNYACTQECLHLLGNLICQFPGTEVSVRLSKWLFLILLILDELHAMSENVSYELQRIRRSMLRRCSIIESSVNPSELSDELSQLRLLSSLISMHFNQN